MRERLRTIVASRYVHLGVGLLVLYGVSSSITHTSRFEKVTDTFKWYCYADYEARISSNSEEVREAEFCREKYRERLISLTEGFFDFQDKKETQTFFLSKGFLYDVWSEKNRQSYILARVIERGSHKAEIPEEVTFNYFILGDRKIVTFPEYKKGYWARDFVSAGEKGIYIHRDSFEPLLRWYFESLWTARPREANHFYNDPLTYSLYRDLQRTCEDIFIKKLYMTKQSAQDGFVKEGFNMLLPTLFAMGARLAADRDSNFPPDYQYLRTCLTGLSLNPSRTMFYILEASRPDSYNPRVRKGWEGLRQRLNAAQPDQITLEQISKAAREVLNGLEDSSTLGK
jgi:hypothetical protein